MDLFVLLNNCAQKGKCTLGKDMFYFNLYLTPAKILPLGANETQYPKEKFKDYCNKSINKSDSGKACTAWVLYNENMDYLYCNDLDWNTKTRCRQH